MAHLDIRPANVLLAPVPAYNSSKRYRASSHGNSSPARSSSGSGNSGASPSTSSFSLFASIQQSINMHTPREGPPGKVNANELKESYENGKESCFITISNSSSGEVGAMQSYSMTLTQSLTCFHIYYTRRCCYIFYMTPYRGGKDVPGSEQRDQGKSCLHVVRNCLQ